MYCKVRARFFWVAINENKKRCAFYMDKYGNQMSFRYEVITARRNFSSWACGDTVKKRLFYDFQVI